MFICYSKRTSRIIVNVLSHSVNCLWAVCSLRSGGKSELWCWLCHWWAAAGVQRGCRTWLEPCSRHGQAEHSGHSHVLLGVQYLHRRRPTGSLSNMFLCLSAFTGIIFFLMFDCNLSFSYAGATPRRMFFTPPFRYFYTLTTSPWAFSRLNIPGLSASPLYIQLSKPLITSVALWWSVSVLYQGHQN